MSVGSSTPSAAQKGSPLRIALAYFATYLLLGLMLTSIGPCMKALEAQTGSSTSAVGFLIVVMSLGYMTGSVAGGRMYGRLPGNRTLSATLLTMAALTLTIPWLGSLWLLIVVFYLDGTALGIIDVGGNTLLTWLYGSAVPPYMNALHLCFGIGGFVGPLIMNGFAAANDNAATTYWLYGALMLPVALWLSRMPSPQAPPADSTSAGVRRLLGSHGWLIGLVAAFAFMHMGAELAFGGYITSYADDLFYSESVARVVNSVFWGGLVVGRLIGVSLATRLRAAGMLRLDLIGAAAGIGLIAAARSSEPVLWIGTALLGMSIASMIPSSINYAGERMPITGQVTALILVGGSLGSTVIPLVLGQLYGDDPGRPEMMVWVTLGAVVAAAAVFAAMSWHSRRRYAPAAPAQG